NESPRDGLKGDPEFLPPSWVFLSREFRAPGKPYVLLDSVFDLRFVFLGLGSDPGASGGLSGRVRAPRPPLFRSNRSQYPGPRNLSVRGVPAPMRPAPPRPPWLSGSLLILGLTLVAYIPAMRSGFIWDDDANVTGNPALTEHGGLRRIWFEPGACPQ